MENNKTIARGFYVSRREGAPGFVFGKVSVKVEDAMAFLKEHANEKGYVNIDMLWNKDGDKITPFLDDWKPSVRSGGATNTGSGNDSFQRTQRRVAPEPQYDDNPEDDLPF